MLKQLGLTYTVKDGFLMITSEESEDQQTEIRVYPVADLAIIPLSLMGGGGMAAWAAWAAAWAAWAAAWAAWAAAWAVWAAWAAWAAAWA